MAYGIGGVTVKNVAVEIIIVVGQVEGSKVDGCICEFRSIVVWCGVVDRSGLDSLVSG